MQDRRPAGSVWGQHLPYQAVASLLPAPIQITVHTSGNEQRMADQSGRQNGHPFLLFRENPASLALMPAACAQDKPSPIGG